MHPCRNAWARGAGESGCGGQLATKPILQMHLVQLLLLLAMICRAANQHSLAQNRPERQHNSSPCQQHVTHASLCTQKLFSRVDTPFHFGKPAVLSSSRTPVHMGARLWI